MLGSVWKLKKLSGIPWNSEERRNPSKRRKISDSGYRNVPEERGKRDVHLECGRIDWELNKLNNRLSRHSLERRDGVQRTNHYSVSIFSDKLARKDYVQWSDGKSDPIARTGRV